MTFVKHLLISFMFVVFVSSSVFAGDEIPDVEEIRELKNTVLVFSSTLSLSSATGNDRYSKRCEIFYNPIFSNTHYKLTEEEKEKIKRWNKHVENKLARKKRSLKTKFLDLVWPGRLKKGLVLLAMSTQRHSDYNGFLERFIYNRGDSDIRNIYFDNSTYFNKENKSLPLHEEYLERIKLRDPITVELKGRQIMGLLCYSKVSKKSNVVRRPSHLNLLCPEGLCAFDVLESECKYYYKEGRRKKRREKLISYNDYLLIKQEIFNTNPDLLFSFLLSRKDALEDNLKMEFYKAYSDFNKKSSYGEKLSYDIKLVEIELAQLRDKYADVKLDASKLGKMIKGSCIKEIDQAYADHKKKMQKSNQKYW